MRGWLVRGGRVRLVCDGTLGGLCRWLRAAGVDTEFVAPVPRVKRDEPSQLEQLQRVAREGGRLVLTRSPRIANVLGAAALLVRDDVVYHQILEVALALGVCLTAAPLSRCREDNTLLEPAGPEQARMQVPPYVARTQQVFVRCPCCQRVYWGATHRDSMLDRLEELEAERTRRMLEQTSVHSGG